jgi:hypothetical protein
MSKITPEERAALVRAAKIAIARADADTNQAAREVERATGERIMPRYVAIHDAKRADLERALVQFTAAQRAFTLALQWVMPGRNLGSVLKTMPAAAARELEDAFRAIGIALNDGMLP